MIGIMSDSHDNLDAIKQAVRLFKEIKCDFIIHAGDFVAPFAAKELEGLSCQVKAVFGNCDGEKNSSHQSRRDRRMGFRKKHNSFTRPKDFKS